MYNTKNMVFLFNLDKKTHRLCPNNEERWWLYWKKRCPPCETEWSSMPLRASRKSVSCVWWKAKSVHWRARIPFFRKQNKLLQNKKCCFGEVSRILFFFWFWKYKIQGFFFYIDINSDLFGLGYYFPKILEPEAVPMLNETFGTGEMTSPPLDLSCDSWLFGFAGMTSLK